MGEVVLTLLLKILLRLTQETKNLAKDTEKCLIFCREAVILFFSRKINSFQDKSPDASKQCIPQGLTGMFLCQLCIFYQFSKLETVAFCSNRGRNEHLNIYAKPLNCPVNTALR